MDKHGIGVAAGSGGFGQTRIIFRIGEDSGEGIDFQNVRLS